MEEPMVLIFIRSVSCKIRTDPADVKLEAWRRFRPEKAAGIIGERLESSGIW